MELYLAHKGSYGGVKNEKDTTTDVVSWIPAASRPRKAGWKSASGERKLKRISG